MVYVCNKSVKGRLVLESIEDWGLREYTSSFPFVRPEMPSPLPRRILLIYSILLMSITPQLTHK